MSTLAIGIKAIIKSLASFSLCLFIYKFYGFLNEIKCNQICGVVYPLTVAHLVPILECTIIDINPRRLNVIS